MDYATQSDPCVGDSFRWRGEVWEVTDIGCHATLVDAWRGASPYVRCINARGVRELVPMDTFRAGGARLCEPDGSPLR